MEDTPLGVAVGSHRHFVVDIVAAGDMLPVVGDTEELLDIQAVVVGNGHFYMGQVLDNLDIVYNSSVYKSSVYNGSVYNLLRISRIFMT